MNADEALGIVMRALHNLNEEFTPEDRIEPSPDTIMFGADAAIDSLSLVSVIVDVEQDVSDAAGKPISLTDDQAIDRDESPFTTPRVLAQYIVELTAQ